MKACCCLAMCLTFPKNSLTESGPFIKLHVLQQATTLSFSYVPAFCTRSTPEYPLSVCKLAAVLACCAYDAAVLVKTNRHLSMSPTCLLLEHAPPVDHIIFLACKCFWYTEGLRYRLFGKARMRLLLYSGAFSTTKPFCTGPVGLVVGFLADIHPLSLFSVICAK